MIFVGVGAGSVGGIRDVASSLTTTSSTTSALPISTPAGCTSNTRDGPLGLGAAGMGGPMPGMGGAPPLGGMGAGMGASLGGSRGPSPHHTSPTNQAIIPPTSVGLQVSCILLPLYMDSMHMHVVHRLHVHVVYRTYVCVSCHTHVCHAAGTCVCHTMHICVIPQAHVCVIPHAHVSYRAYVCHTCTCVCVCHATPTCRGTIHVSLNPLLPVLLT